MCVYRELPPHVFTSLIHLCIHFTGTIVAQRLPHYFPDTHAPLRRGYGSRKRVKNEEINVSEWTSLRQHYGPRYHPIDVYCSALQTGTLNIGLFHHLPGASYRLYGLFRVFLRIF